MQSACLALCLLCLISILSACYITNCPLGGKRSIMDMEIRQVDVKDPMALFRRRAGSYPRCPGQYLSLKQQNKKTDYLCMPCGPGNRGRCFGSSICCGEEIGCYIGTSETMRCQKEDYLPSPCEPAGRLCGQSGGKCASSGICCTEESCATDPMCDIRIIFSSD